MFNVDLERELGFLWRFEDELHHVLGESCPETKQETDRQESLVGIEAGLKESDLMLETLEGKSDAFVVFRFDLIDRRVAFWRVERAARQRSRERKRTDANVNFLKEIGRRRSAVELSHRERVC